ncbi:MULTISPECIES: metal-sulfur cluster assembly factor [Niastella]|uniref:Metal-sulfur cluster assembly factor n=1 Tax=Niastella soli TaxID=2821487 RepID=A0ABS3YYD9_9BACT|nr:metal-sulfur cluster assembly factor [Niastella soli]MBO9202893.1 metal-sulfur cluster assembly factor [Niastella soli]
MEDVINNVDNKQKLKALAVLYNVMDPELFVNIMDLGLVYDLIFTPQSILVTMTLSTSHCPMGEAIVEGVKNVLAEQFTDHVIEVELVWEPKWSFDMISAEGRRQLGIV